METTEERNEFESKINSFINKTLDNYDINSKKYLDFIKNVRKFRSKIYYSGRC